MNYPKYQRHLSRVTRWFGELAASSSVAVATTLAVLAYGTFLIVKGFPGRWAMIFQTAVSAITLSMLFVIQHTQNRQQVAIQLKLDELIRSVPEADDLLVHIEKSDDEELLEREHSHLSQHESLRTSNSVRSI